MDRWLSIWTCNNFNSIYKKKFMYRIFLHWKLKIFYQKFSFKGKSFIRRFSHILAAWIMATFKKIHNWNYFKLLLNFSRFLNFDFSIFQTPRRLKGLITLAPGEEKFENFQLPLTFIDFDFNVPWNWCLETMKRLNNKLIWYSLVCTTAPSSVLPLFKSTHSKTSRLRWFL